MAGSYTIRNININSTFKRHFKLLQTPCRHFCSKDRDVTSGSSSPKDDISKQKSDEDEKNKESAGKMKFLKFKPKPVSDEMKESAKQKLKALLSSIEIAPKESISPLSNLDLAKPVKRISKKERLRLLEEAQITPEKEMNMAVKAVASTFKEDVEKVESELKEKLATLNLTKDNTVIEEIKETEDVPVIDNKLNEKLMSSVQEVAETISDSPIPPRSELAKRLMRLSLDQKLATDEKKSIRSVIEGLVIKKQLPATQSQALPDGSEAASFQHKRLMPKTRAPSLINTIPVNLFGAAPLNMFSPNTEINPDSTNTFWQKLQERELRLFTQFAPANAFEEMIIWTEQGKHWKFPIDNEAEMGADENIGFHEHVFLEKHLNGFPKRGPIRHFMELVCVGLSKNPYISVERKIENIDWFRNYFKEKEELLRECGVLD